MRLAREFVGLALVACFLLVPGLLFATAGCSAVVNPDADRLGAGGDSGVDTGPPIILRDAGTDASRDSMTTMPPDTGIPAECMGEDVRCQGETLIACVDGRVEATDCAASNSFCDVDECRDWECVPGSATCDGDSAIRCDARGTGATSVECPSGCDEGVCLDAPPACAGLPSISLGDTVAVDLCGNRDDDSHVPTGDGGGCPTGAVRSNGDDLVYTLRLEDATTVAIDLWDDDGSAAIDTIVYLRSACDEPEPQLACGDDLRCDQSFFGCAGGRLYRELRHSRITERLAAGTYYIVIDSFNVRADGVVYQCGDVRLRVQAITGAVTP